MNSVLAAANFIATRAEHVSIDRDRVASFVASFRAEIPTFWLSLAPYNVLQLSRDAQLDFLLSFDAINFSYWGEPKWAVAYEGVSYDGTWAVTACFGKAISSGVPLLDSQFRSRISLELFSEIFKGAFEMPLLRERWRITSDVARQLLATFGGHFSNVIEAANHDAGNLLGLVVKHFPSFDDQSVYAGESVFFYKRAQLLVADVHQLLIQRGEPGLANTDVLTAFADYKVPQTLRRLGMLLYDPSLARQVDARAEIAPHTPAENEIRGCTIWAVEIIRQELEKIGRAVPTIDIDHYMWLLGQDKRPDDKPYHRTRTTAY
jgi:hypothetical protein